MGGVLVLWLFLFAAGAVDLSQGISHEIHLLRPRHGSGGHRVPGVSCLSWRLGVEAHNIIEWSTVPQACESYVGHYMLGRQYRRDSAAVVSQAIAHVKGLKLAGDGRDVWVFDVDDTSLSNLPYYAQHGFGVEPFNFTEFSNWVFEGKAPALPETLKLYKKLLPLGVKVVFITGRGEAQRNITAANLRKVGFHTWEKLVLRGPSDVGTTAVAYKSNARRKLEKRGYRIIGNIGDQWSDILGTHTGNRTFKLPDPMYYISLSNFELEFLTHNK